MNPSTSLPSLAILLLSASAAFAQETTRPADNPFAKGTNAFSLDGSYVQVVRGERDRFYNVNVGFGKYVFDNTAFTIDLQGSWVNIPGEESAILGGIGIMGRTHLFRFDRLSLYFDGGVDFTYADQNVPHDGTHFNFNAKTGPGAMWQLEDHAFLYGGARYFHLSNGRIQGPERNPAFDGVQFYAGMMWTW